MLTEDQAKAKAILEGRPVFKPTTNVTYWPSGYTQHPPTVPKEPPKKRARTRSFNIPSDAQMVAAVKAVEKKMKKEQNQSMGGVCTDLYAGVSSSSIITSTTSNGQIVLVNGIERGSAEFQRLGNKATMVNLRIYGPLHYWFSQTAAGTVVSNAFRMVVVWDKTPNGVVPKFDEIFGQTSTNGTESTEIWDPKKFDNTNRFQILRDKTVACNPQYPPQATPALGSQTYLFDEFIPLGKRVTQYQGSDATAASISSGGLYVIFRAMENDSITPNENFVIPAPQLTARLRFLP